MSKEFKDWFEEFHYFNGGYKPKSIDSFVEKTKSSKKEITKLLGGIRHIQKVEVDDKIIPLDEYNAKYTIDKILQRLPDYLETYKLKREDLLMPNLPSGIKTTKHIMTHARKVFKDRYSYNFDDVNYCCQDLGNMYTANKPKAGTFWLNITTSPQAFALIGHYGPDFGSCFSQWGINKTHKYSLALSDNTFVVLITSSEIEETPNHDNNLARAWGFYNPKTKTFNISNLYPHSGNDKISLATIKEVIRIGTTNLLKSDVKIYNDLMEIKDNKIYLNGFPRWTIATKNVKAKQILNPTNA